MLHELRLRPLRLRPLRLRPLLPEFALAITLLVGACGSAPVSSATPPENSSTACTRFGWLLGSWSTGGEGAAIERWTCAHSADGAERLQGQGAALVPVDCSNSEVAGGCPPDEQPRESISIVSNPDGSFDYIAEPIDQERTVFHIVEADGTHLVAENPAHDFPTRIVYRVISDAQVHVEVSGNGDGFTLDFVRM